MPNKSAKGIDRRDLIMASIATVGGAAAVAVNASAANAQDAATPSANPASGTVYTGDVIEGKKVVSALDVNELEPGKKHLLYFQGVNAAFFFRTRDSLRAARSSNTGFSRLLPNERSSRPWPSR
jgi:hypothetical protein